MRIARIRVAGSSHAQFALDEGDHFALLAHSPYETPLHRAQVAGHVERSAATLCCPCTPSKIVCVGRNYAAHARELGHDVPSTPTLFLKPPSSVIGPEDTILRPVGLSALIHHEGEIAVVIGSRLACVSVSEALDGVLGYTCANDVTARDLQREDQRFTRAKGFDTFCPLGPVILAATAVADPQELTVRLAVDGEIRQFGRAREMVFPIAQQISYISHFMTLVPGDVILTGTPEGVGPLSSGESVTVEVDGVGILRNFVADRPRVELGQTA